MRAVPAGRDAAPPDPDGSLVGTAARALSWSLLSTAVARLSTLAIGVALARLLGPAEFGAFAVATVALLAVLSFNELGVSLAVVRWPGDPAAIAPTVATISVVSSVAIYLGSYLGAPAFAAAMGAPQAAGVVRLLGLCVIINGIVAAPVAMLQREFRQRRKMVIDQVSTWVGALLSIGCAVAGMGAVSLAIGQLAGALTGAVLFIAAGPRWARLGFDRAKARALLRFGLPLAGSSIVVFAVANVDKLVVGAVLGPGPLGLYVLAFNLSNWPVTVFSQPVRSVAPALLARLQGDPLVLRETFRSTAVLLAAVTLPVCVLLAAVAEPLIRLLYGVVWLPAATVLPWLGLLAALRILFELSYDYLVVLADTGRILTAQLLWLAVLVPALWLGTGLGGLVGAGVAQFAVALLVVLPIYARGLSRSGVSPASLGARMAVPVGVAASVAFLATAAGRLLDAAFGGHPAAADLLTLLVAGLISVTAVALLVFRMRGTLRMLRAAEVTG